MSKLLLPKTYTDRSGKYPQHEGKPKLSYSQYNSWKDAKYHPDYIKQYFIGINMASGIFAQAGTDFGTMVEWIGNGKVGEKPKSIILPQLHCEEIAAQVDYPKNSIYEDLVVVDCGDFVIEGFADRVTYWQKEMEAFIVDFKTGNTKKPEKYTSPDYKQTRLYAYQKENEGYKIKGCEVQMYARKGNGSEKSPILLTGEKLVIETPYDRKDTEEWLKKDVTKVAKEISDCYQTYVKYFK